MVKPLNVKKILDVGCGEGITLKRLEEEKIGQDHEGIDYSKDAIEIGKKIHPTLKIKIGNVYDLDYRDNAFDMTICTEVLEHLENPKKAVQEIKRVSSKYLVFSVPNEPFFIMANFLRGKYLKTLGNHPEHINHWTARGFERFLEKEGLRIVKSKHPFAWTLVLAQKS